MQNIQQIPLNEMPQFTAIDRAYASGEANLKDFYKHTVAWESFQKIIDEKQQAYSTSTRQTLVQVLNAQYANLPKDILYINNIQAQIQLLAQEHTFVVTTAHQPSLVTGPLYYIYKILAVVRLSQELKQRYPQYNFVPVYVLGGEDHDFEEIASINLFNKKLTWQQNDKAGSVARMSTQDLDIFLQELENILGEGDKAKEIYQAIYTAYTTHDNYGLATRHLLQLLFGARGVVVVDADDVQLKRLFIPIMENDLFRQDSQRLVNEAVKDLEKVGYSNQAFAREINLFYFLPNARQRIIFDEESGHYQVLNTDLKFTPKALLQHLHEHPENFSPNVILRPLYQETILPNLAYVGGGGELAYWLERKKQFEFFNLPLPMLIRRPSLLLLDAMTQQRLQKLNFTVKDLIPHYDIIVKEYLRQQEPTAVDCQTEKENVLAEFDKLIARISQTDKDLATFIAAQRAQTENAFAKIAEKLTRAAKKREETHLSQIQKLKEKLFPNNGLQERTENFLPYFLAYGFELFDYIEKAIIDPLAQEFIILSLPIDKK